MIFNKQRYDNQIEQSAKYFARFLIKKSTNKSNIVGLSSSYDNKKIKFIICKKICEEIINYNKSVLLFDADYMLENTENFDTRSLSSSVFDDIIKNEIIDSSTTHDLVILNVPCVPTNVISLDYLSVCNKIFLIERYMYTKYSEFNSTIEKMKLSGLDVSGIISYS